MKGKRTHSFYVNSIIVIISLSACILVAEVALRFIFPNGYYQYQPDPGIHATSEYTYHIKHNL